MRRVLPLVAAMVALLIAASAGAMMIKVPLDRMATGAAAVVQGRVVTLQSAWTPDHKTIETQVSVVVDESWKGVLQKGQTVTLRVPGGEVGDDGIMVEHAPVFARDESVILFLDSAPEGGLRVSADEQGKYTVVNDWVVGFEHLPVKLAEFRAEIGRYLPAVGR